MIVFAHLLNDNSGSPRVLLSAIQAAGNVDSMRLFVGSGGNGVLSQAGIPVTRYWYRRTGYRLLTLVTYLASQVLLLLKLLGGRGIDRHAVVYVNTLLPFGAAIYGRLTGRRVVYHVHEISISPAPLRWWLVGVARLTSSLNIYVSDAHRAALPIPGVPSRRVHNALSAGFAERARRAEYTPRRGGRFVVLMVASLRDYKGVPELLALCESLAGRIDIDFELVVNDEQPEIERYFRDRALPGNLRVHPRVADVTPFYAKTSVLLNLSRVDQCVETFGLTILEAMAFGVPVIVPPVGGPTELADDDVEGYRVDSRDIDRLARRVVALADDPALCERMSEAARVRAALFTEEAFARGIREALAEVKAA